MSCPITSSCQQLINNIILWTIFGIFQFLDCVKVSRKQTHKHDLLLSSAGKERNPSVSGQKLLYKHAPFGWGSKPITPSLSQPGQVLKHKFSICIWKAILQIQTTNNLRRKSSFIAGLNWPRIKETEINSVLKFKSWLNKECAVWGVSSNSQVEGTLKLK